MRKELLVGLVCMTLYFGFLGWIFQVFQKDPGAEGAEVENISKNLEKTSHQLEELSRQLARLQGELEDSKEGSSERKSQLPPPPLPENPSPEKSSFLGGSSPIRREDKIAVLIISCNRPDISRALDKVLAYRPKGRFPVVVSQDCGDQTTAKVVEQYDHDVIHIRQPNLGPIDNIPPNFRHFENYYKISRHYKWALTEVFDALMFDQVIILEDDLEISEDFFNYFEATLPLLRSDPTLFCVSAWNDNGKQEFISDPQKLYRSDFFPGLGWMMTRELWEEFDTKWPAGFWDDWVREPEQRRGRACIRPEISRTYTFGRIGASNGQYFDTHLKYIVLNSESVDFKSKDLTYLTKEKYDPAFIRAVEQAKKVSLEDVRSLSSGTASYQIEYSSNSDYERISVALGLMSDLRAGVPRGAYLGIVPFKLQGNTVYIVPRKPWNGYVP